MNIDKFANYLIALLIFLQLLGLVLFLVLFSAFGGKGLLYATILMIGINVAALYGTQKINVYDNQGKQVSFGNLFGDVIALMMITLAVSIILFITGMFYSLKTASEKGYSSGSAVLLPILSTVSFYGSLMIFKLKN